MTDVLVFLPLATMNILDSTAWKFKVLRSGSQYTGAQFYQAHLDRNHVHAFEFLFCRMDNPKSNYPFNGPKKHHPTLVTTIHHKPLCISVLIWELYRHQMRGRGRLSQGQLSRMIVPQRRRCQQDLLGPKDRY
jgi:hypothetical protein